MKQRLYTCASILAFAGVYYFFGRIGLSLAFVNPSASPVWPPAGLALAAILLWGDRLWWGIFIGAFLVNITHGSMMTTLGVAVGNSLEALVAAELVRRLAGGVKCFEKVGTNFWFVFLAGVSTIISPFFGVTSLCMGGFVPWLNFPGVWLTWWFGDMTSCLIVAPLIIAWVRKPFFRMYPPGISEGVFLAVTILFISGVIFMGQPPIPGASQLEYVAIAPLLWSAFRFGQRGAVSGGFVVLWVALWGTLAGTGPFVRSNANESLLLVQTYIATLMVMSLILAAAVSERRKAEQRHQLQDTVSRILVESVTTNEAGGRILSALGESQGWEVGAIWNLRPEGKEMICTRFWSSETSKVTELEELTKQMIFGIDESHLGQVWLNGKPVWISDIAQNTDSSRRDVALRTGMLSSVCFPLQMNGQCLGVVECFSRERRERDNNSIEILLTIGSQMAQFIIRKWAEEASKESEERFRQVTENIQEVFWMTDTEKKRMIYVSPGYEKIWGYSSRSLYDSARNWIEAIHPEDRERVRAAALAKQISGEYHEVYRIVRSDGAIRWIRDRAFPVLNGSGRVYRVVGIAEDVTLQKQSEKVLWESEKRFRTLFECAPIGVAVHDATGRYLQANQAYQLIFGYSEQELQDRRDKPLTSLDHRSDNRQLFDEIRNGKRDFYKIEEPYLRKNGQMLWASCSVSAIRDASGNLEYIISMVEDITERKDTERIWAHYASIIASSNVAIIGKSLTGRITSWNDGAQKVFGYSAEEMLGKSMAELIPENRRGEEERDLAKIEQGDRVDHFDTVRIRRDGKRIDASITISPIRNSDGLVVGASEISRDITEAKRAEAQLVILAQAVQSTAELICITDPEDRCVFANRAFQQAYGYSDEEILGKTPGVLFGSNNPRSLLKEILVQSHAGGWRGELTGRRRDGTEFPIFLSTSQIKDPLGRVIGLMGVAQDITERKRLQNAVVEVSEREQERIGQDIHDNLCQYLFNIAMNCNLLKQDLAAKSKPEAEAAAKILAQVENAMVEARGVARGLNPSKVIKGDLAVVIQDLAKSTSRNSRVACVAECADTLLVQDQAMASHLYRIAKEAVHNAVKHAQATRIDIQLRNNTDSGCLIVKDNGVGMADGGRSPAGMGLDMMRYRASAIGGELKIQKGLPGGTVITCIFPQKSLSFVKK